MAQGPLNPSQKLNWWDYIFPRLNPLPEDYLEKRKTAIEEELRDKSARAQGRPNVAKEWAEQELQLLRDVKDDNRRAKESLADYRNPSMTVLLTVLPGAAGVISAIALQPMWAGFRCVVGSLAVLCALYISANALRVLLCSIEGTRARSYPADPAPLNRPGGLHFVALARDRVWARHEWRETTNAIISQRSLAEVAWANVGRGLIGSALLAGMTVLVVVSFSGANSSEDDSNLQVMEDAAPEETPSTEALREPPRTRTDLDRASAGSPTTEGDQLTEARADGGAVGQVRREETDGAGE